MRGAIGPYAATLVALLLATACGRAPETGGLVGAWRTKIRFATGAFAEIKDLEFMCVFNAGGTMTESSNYDGAPPVPPAYGVWKQNGPGRFEAKYAFYTTKAPASFDDIAKGGGFMPAGRGVLTETISLSDDGTSYASKIVYAGFDQAGEPVEGGGEGTGTGTRLFR